MASSQDIGLTMVHFERGVWPSRFFHRVPFMVAMGQGGCILDFGLGALGL